MNTYCPDVVDTRIVFKVYAGLVWALSVAAFAVAVAHPGGAQAAMSGMAGAALIAAGCFAIGFSRIGEPESRHRALFWFSLGHAAIVAILLVMTVGHRPEKGVDLGLPAGAIAVLILFEQGDRRGALHRRRNGENAHGEAPGQAPGREPGPGHRPGAQARPDLVGGIGVGTRARSVASPRLGCRPPVVSS